MEEKEKESSTCKVVLLEKLVTEQQENRAGSFVTVLGPSGKGNKTCNRLKGRENVESIGKVGKCVSVCKGGKMCE